MIEAIKIGDITDQSNKADIVIGMNTEAQDLRGLGLRFLEVSSLKALMPFKLGTILTFDFDDSRMIHMIVCHALFPEGWIGSEKYVRLGLDYLWGKYGNSRQFSVVQIGNGRVGKKYNADPATILAAIATSFLPVTLYIKDNAEHSEVLNSQSPPRKFLQASVLD